ncbi:hypothetical protein NKH77_02875 [Streptomyces sp. M19]
MAMSISVVLLLLIPAVMLMRGGKLRASHALICVLLGFYLASSSVAPTISRGMSATADVVSGIRP